MSLSLLVIDATLSDVILFDYTEEIKKAANGCARLMLRFEGTKYYKPVKAFLEGVVGDLESCDLREEYEDYQVLPPMPRARVERELQSELKKEIRIALMGVNEAIKVMSGEYGFAVDDIGFLYEIRDTLQAQQKLLQEQLPTPGGRGFT